ncbi:hypothetical protein [Roseibacillus ishigakijimensis]|uniref:Transcription elongation factor GreAB n=1 Tax=Roseibacillus ishigakijimensis TaxID=454146 RepID=A0A934VL61_9BACT|nr:hypothetical protein [Roseibacillus ishigakijimensis]MBK1832892.1 hypothetical protein [Roseibacillus ishigakijimensis]
MANLKEQLLGAVQAKLGEELSALERALADSSAAATDPDSKAESKYDTRSLEMSYLASGQARQAESLREALRELENFALRDFAVTERVEVGALVELEQEGEWRSYLLLPVGGGLEVTCGEQQVTTLSPESPLFALLEGRRMGEPLPNGASVSELG